MYSNNGERIKTFAKVFCCFGIIVSVFSGMIVYDSNGGLGFIVIIVGSVVSCFSSLFLYGLGELVKNVAIIADKLPNNGTAAAVENSEDDVIENADDAPAAENTTQDDK